MQEKRVTERGVVRVRENGWAPWIRWMDSEAGPAGPVCMNSARAKCARRVRANGRILVIFLS